MRTLRNKLRRHFDFRTQVTNLCKIKNIKTFETEVKSKLSSIQFQTAFLYSKAKFENGGFGGDELLFPSSSLEQITCATIIKIAKELALLNKYIELKNRYESFILVGKYEDALNIVDKVREATGLSYWYIESKLSTLSLINDIERIESFYKEINSKRLTNIEKRDLDLIFDRTNPKTQPERIEYSLDSLTEVFNLDNNDEVQLINFMHRFNCSYKYDSRAILSYLWQCNIIDIYNAFTRLLISKSIDETIIELFTEQITKISELVKDDKLSNFIANNEDIKLDCEFTRICDEYIYGKYEICVNLAELYLTKHPNRCSLYEIYINSLINSGIESSIRSEGLLKKLIDIIVENYGNIYNNKELKKIKQCFNNIDALQYITLLEAKKIVNFDSVKVEKIYSYFNSISTPATPFNRAIKIPSSITSQLSNTEIDSKSLEEVPIYRIKKRYADWLYENENYDNAIEQYSSINDIPKHMTSEIANKIILSHFLNGEILKGAKNICRLYFEQKLNINRLDIDCILEVIDSHDKDYTTEIEIPIAIYLLTSQKAGESQIAALHLDDYLDEIGIQKPSEIEVKNEKEDFLLRKVCNLEILKSLNTVRNIYKSSNDRMLDRTLILSKLLEANEEQEIHDEIRFLRHQFSRSLCVKNIGKGKLYINKEFIANVVKEDGSERITEYMNTLRETDTEKLTYEYLKTHKNTALFNRAYELMMYIRDVYTLDPNYGLDYALNTKIRHNGIVPAIRSIFESEGIICSKEQGGYKNNAKFENKCKSILLDSIHTQFQNYIKDFSKHIDTRLEKLKSVYMHVVTNEKKEDDLLFKFKFDEHNVVTFIIASQTMQSSEQIIEHILNVLHFKTEKCLNVGRELIKTGLKDDFTNQLKELRSKLNGNFCDNFKEGISLTINRMPSKMDEISEWLGFQEVIGENFNIEIAIYEAENFVKSINPNIKIKTQIDNNEEKVIDGKFLMPFINIFIILFENACRERKNTSFVDIEVCVNFSSDLVLISVANTSKEINTKEIDEINNQVNDPAYINHANREKKSGFYKIKRHVEVDMQSKGHIKLSSQNSRFIFEIYIESSNLIVEMNSEQENTDC